MSPLELAAGMVLCVNPDTPTLLAAPPGFTTRGAVEKVMLTAPLRPPCVVSFSGGR